MSTPRPRSLFKSRVLGFSFYITSNDSTPPDDLKRKLANIDERLGEIAKLLERQSEWQRARSVWRWRPSLKTLFVAIAMLACMAAWSGAEMRKSKREHQAITALVSDGAQVQLGPSESILVALLPGKPDDPPAFKHLMLRSLDSYKSCPFPRL